MLSANSQMHDDKRWPGAIGRLARRIGVGRAPESVTCRRCEEGEAAWFARPQSARGRGRALLGGALRLIRGLKFSAPYLTTTSSLSPRRTTHHTSQPTARSPPSQPTNSRRRLTTARTESSRQLLRPTHEGSIPAQSHLQSNLQSQRLYMYSPRDNAFRQEPPPKLQKFRDIRKPSSNYHCTNG